MKLLRTIRLDPSDTFVFERAAEPGEWAVSGSFLFLDCDASSLSTKERHALRSGFLGTVSLGFSTLATVSDISKTEYADVIEHLAQAFMRKLGAPDMDSARAAAQEEVHYAQTLCDYPINTLIAVQRSLDETGAVREQFRTLRPREENAGQDGLHTFARAFTFHEVDDAEDEPAAQNAPADHVDLLALTKGAQP